MFQSPCLLLHRAETCLGIRDEKPKFKLFKSSAKRIEGETGPVSSRGGAYAVGSAGRGFAPGSRYTAQLNAHDKNNSGNSVLIEGGPYGRKAFVLIT